jgi:hypothetical protein
MGPCTKIILNKRNPTTQTDRTIPNNNPDIIIHGNGKGTCRLIGVVISGDRNVIRKEAEKILKYNVVLTEVQRLWNGKKGYQ